MLPQEVLDGLGPELAASARRRTEEHVTGEVAQLLAEPARDGHAEAGLATLEDLGWKVRCERAPQRDLAGRAVEAQVVGEGERELRELEVEQRRPQLEGVRHRCDI